MNEPLWRPSEERVREANLTRFTAFASERTGRAFPDYEALWRWSVEDRASFWQAIWDFGGVRASRPADEVLVNGDAMPGARWFVGAELNFAENLLRRRDDHLAIIFRDESGRRRELSYRELAEQVAGLAAALRALGIRRGDRVAGFLPNLPESIVAMLATTSIGAIWSSCSPDFGIKGVLDRFGQIAPKVLFTADGYHYAGKKHDSLERVQSMLPQLESVGTVIVVPNLVAEPDLDRLDRAVALPELLAKHAGAELQFEPLPFDHPIYILYSSGTTGVPKCIVHGAGGTLLQHVKELWLHADLSPADRIFYFTTCGWMMWNWLVSALTAEATVVLFDGSPFHPGPEVLWEMAEQEGVQIFGASAKYYAALEKAGVKPGTSFDLGHLRSVLSTGSPLSVDSFEYIYRDVKADVNLASIAGGTDIVSCFALGNPTLPVYAGEIQCRGLGMSVEAFDAAGKAVIGEQAELVCTKAFPSMPVSFWDDPEGERYHAAYFDVYSNIWRHGDFVEITERGGLVIYGRSDATLNPGGVRIGTAEIYRPVEAMAEIADSIVIGQSVADDVRVVLFVKLAEGTEWSEELEQRIRSEVRRNATPRHVPARILAIAEIPYTISGKKVELAVRKVVHGQPVDNRDALANPEVLELYRDLEALRS